MKSKVLKKNLPNTKALKGVWESHKLSPLSYMDAFKVPREISKPFILLVEKWVASCGVEDTVKRLKDIKLDFVRAYSGMPMVAAYISRNRSNTRFRGPLRGLQTYGYRSDKHFSRIIQLLQVYTLFRAPAVTITQEMKFLKGVTAPFKDIPARIQLGILQASNAIPVCKGLPEPKSYVFFHPRSPSKREPRIDGTSVPEGEETMDVALDWLNFIAVKAREDKEAIPLLNLMTKAMRDVDGGWGAWWTENPLNIGKIGFIQEPGYKLRAVANPSRLVQCALEPLGSYLFQCMAKLPWDCTFNQSKAFPVIQEHIRNGGTVHSVDLTDASSNFPLWLQQVMLYHVFPNDTESVRAFLYASRSPWFYNIHGEKRLVQWTKGQPLGLYPSFASAFLTHGFLLLYLNEYQHKNDFFVLGDDVVILSDALHTKYVNVLAELSCPVSEAKCLSSNRIGEFGGKIITKDLIIPQLKWNNPSDDSFLDIVRNIGVRALRLLRPRQRAIAEKLLEVPALFGGIGFNPRGIPLSERIFLALQMEKVGGYSYLMSYNRVLSKLFYESKTPMTEVTLSESANCFDKKQIAYVVRYLPNLTRFYDILGLNLASIAADLDLPIENFQRFRSLLCTLEAKYS